MLSVTFLVFIYVFVSYGVKLPISSWQSRFLKENSLLLDYWYIIRFLNSGFFKMDTTKSDTCNCIVTDSGMESSEIRNLMGGSDFSSCLVPDKIHLSFANTRSNSKLKRSVQFSWINMAEQVIEKTRTETHLVLIFCYENIEDLLWRKIEGFIFSARKKRCNTVVRFILVPSSCYLKQKCYDFTDVLDSLSFFLPSWTINNYSETLS